MASRVNPELASPRFSDAWPLWDKDHQAINRDEWLSIQYEHVAMEYRIYPDRVTFRLPAATLLATNTSDIREQGYPALSDSADCTVISHYVRDYFESLHNK